MELSNKRRLSLLFVLMIVSVVRAQSLDFTSVNNIFSSYIFSNLPGDTYSSCPFLPSLTLGTSKDQFSSSVSCSINFNTLYLNGVKSKLDKEQAEYSQLMNSVFKYEKINGDFFTLVSLVAENQFLLSHSNLDLDIEEKTYINNMYIELLRKVIEGYSGIAINDEIVNEYVELLFQMDYSDFILPNIYQIGFVKNAEERLINETDAFNDKSKNLFGYLPVLDIGLNYFDRYESNQEENLQSNFSTYFNLSIPNLGLKGSVQPLYTDDNLLWNWSISFSLPIIKNTANTVTKNEYSYSSESFLIELSSMLLTYKRLIAKGDEMSQYELILLKGKLLFAIKKYMELY